MATTLKSVRGMNDLMPPDSAKWLHFERRCRELFTRYGYEEIRTPILEPTALFSRGIGEATDIVEKEMYTFVDRKDRSMTMRPEMTASCVRAYIQHAVHKHEPVTRWFYSGPMFRYERMQTGRYRQFYQIGVEAFGVAEATVEAEQIAMLHELYSGLGLTGLRVVVNSVGNADDRPAYRKALVDFLTPHKEALCADCVRRIDTNPMRVLDCKNPTCKAIVVDAPNVLDHLSENSRVHFDSACKALEAYGVPFEVDPRMVRGLDYYTGTVFEILSASRELGAHSTIVAGGRYDSLVSSLGGPDVPAVGFALGVERAVLTIQGEAQDFVERPVAFIATRGEAAKVKGLALAHQLRLTGLRIEIEHRSVSIKSQFKRADKLRARYVITIGDTELESGSAKLKNMDEHKERDVPFEDIEAALRSQEA